MPRLEYRVTFAGLKHLEAKLDQNQFRKLLVRHSEPDPDRTIASVDQGLTYRNDWLSVEKTGDPARDAGAAVASGRREPLTGFDHSHFNY